MKKYSILMVAVYMFFCIAASGCGETRITNKEQFFTETSLVSKVESDLNIEIKKLFAYKEPQFFNPGTYEEKKELFLYKSVNVNYSPITTLLNPTKYGWSIFNNEPFSNKQSKQDIIFDQNNYNELLDLANVYDENNDLTYTIHSGNTLHCSKLTKDGEEESWSLNLRKHYFYIWRRTENNNIIILGDNDIAVIDTKKAKIVATFKLNEKYLIFNILLKDDRLWIFASSEFFNLRGKLSKQSWVNVFLVDDIYARSPNIYMFKDKTQRYKIQDKRIVLMSNNDISIIDENLNTIYYNLANYHKDCEIKEKFSGEYAIERKSIIFRIRDKDYLLDVDNPSVLNELPNNLIAFNNINVGHRWSYYYLENGYCYGYDIDKKEKTWWAKTEDTPIISSKYGVLFVSKDYKKVLAYGAKK